MKKIIFPLIIILSLVMMTACSATTPVESEAAPDAESEAAPAAENEATPEAETYPNYPIKVIVPFGAGGGTDLFARIVVDQMSRSLDTPVEIVNVPGGSATIGTSQVVDSESDGYTLGFCNSTALCVTPLHGQTSYTIEDITPIVGAYTSLNAFVVPADSDIMTYDDLVEYIEGKGGVANYGGSGTGGMQHLAVEEWMKQANSEWQLTMIPYDGDAAEVAALLSGELEFAVVQLNGIKSYVESEQVRLILAFGEPLPAWITGNEEIEVDTTVSLGFTSSVSATAGFWGPKDLPEEVVMAIHDAFVAVKDNPEMLESIANMGLEIAYLNTAEYTEALINLGPAAEELLKELDMLQ